MAGHVIAVPLALTGVPSASHAPAWLEADQHEARMHMAIVVKVRRNGANDPASRCMAALHRRVREGYGPCGADPSPQEDEATRWNAGVRGTASGAPRSAARRGCAPGPPRYWVYSGGTLAGRGRGPLGWLRSPCRPAGSGQGRGGPQCGPLVWGDAMKRVTVDGKPFELDGATLLDAVRLAGADVPTICQHDRLSNSGACRMCLARLVHKGAPIAACVTPIADGQA